MKWTAMEWNAVERRTDRPGRRVLRTSIGPAPLKSRRPHRPQAAQPAQGILATPT
ncbi:hypothetical protein TPA0905_30320 [Streptomyces olivaceus]|nr:hypothetical protein TPA0905_30320 [Streptomyces olivaceus]